MRQKFSLKRVEQGRFRFHVFSAVYLVAIILILILTTITFTSTFSIHSLPLTLIPSYPSKILNNQTIYIVKDDVVHKTVPRSYHNRLVVPKKITKEQRIKWFKERLPQFNILKSTKLTRGFKKRAEEFLEHGCEVRIFMTWISFSSRVFGDREILALDALFESNPNSCLMILSNSMDSNYGFQILRQFTARGFCVEAITPDLDFLFNNTPAQSWLDYIKSGKRDPGRIPLAQNLSNLIRLAILYKYGGVYLDTDFIILKDISNIHNSIGAQSATHLGRWITLNNAVLIFDKNHPLLYIFMKEFATTYDGNKWGYNGPYLVSRVVRREAKTHKMNFTILAPNVFYPVNWIAIRRLFISPVNMTHQRVERMVIRLRRSSYGVHLWNKKSSILRIQEGSVIARLIAQHCVICHVKY